MKSKLINHHNLTDSQQAELKRQIAIMQAYQHGKLVDELYLEFDDIDEWVQSIEPTWDWSSFDYRIAKIQSKYTPTEFIDCKYDDNFIPHTTVSGLRIKRKAVKEQIESPQVTSEPSDEVSIKLDEIDKKYASKTKLTWKNVFKLIFRG